MTQQVNIIEKVNDLNIVKGTVVAWLDTGLFIEESDAFFNNNEDINLIQKIRIFNTGEELLAWRTKDGIKYRHLKDDNQENPYHEAQLLLTGVMAKKTIQALPALAGKDVYIKTRNYIGYLDSWHAQYIDSRFVEFCNPEKS